jgi:hypothetical protein
VLTFCNGHECPVWNIPYFGQQNAGQPTVTGTRKVPIAASRESQDRPFEAIVRGAKADLQFAISFP